LGTLGNSNFVSALLGMASIASFALVLQNSKSLGLRVLLLVSLSVSIFVIFESKSSQGLLIFVIGVTLVLYSRYKYNFSFVWRKGILSFAFLSTLIGGFGVINVGPLASILYQPSVTFRGDFWNAGLRMSMDNPMFGVGLDAYGDWYRSSRSEVATFRQGVDVTSNSAHNVFLDMLANGGIPLLLSYSIIVLLVIKSCIHTLRILKSYEPYSIALISCWVGFLIQSIISINQLGLAVWGWIMGGAIIANERMHGKSVQTFKQSNRSVAGQVSSSAVVTSAISLGIGVLLFIWPFTNDLSFKRAFRLGDVELIQAATLNFPPNPRYLVTSAEVFMDNALYDESLAVARRIIDLNPREFNGWRLIVMNPESSPAEKSIALQKMKELDPFNNTLGK
jgi:hypothetical protein